MSSISPVVFWKKTRTASRPLPPPRRRVNRNLLPPPLPPRRLVNRNLLLPPPLRLANRNLRAPLVAMRDDSSLKAPSPRRKSSSTLESSLSTETIGRRRDPLRRLIRQPTPLLADPITIEDGGGGAVRPHRASLRGLQMERGSRDKGTIARTMLRVEPRALLRAHQEMEQWTRLPPRVTIGPDPREERRQSFQ